MRLASAGKTHFPESDVRDIVSANLGALLVHCRDVDAPVRSAAQYVILTHATGSQPFVQQLISEAMLGLMADLLPEAVELSIHTSFQAVQCSDHLPWIIRTLTKPQRQKWVSLLVRHLQGQTFYQKTLMEHLELLWRADDDPRRSYAEAEQRLRTLSQRSSRDGRRELIRLRLC